MEIIKDRKPRDIPLTDTDRSNNQKIYQALGFSGGSRTRKGRRLIEFQILCALVDGLLILAGTLLLCSLYLFFLRTEFKSLLPGNMYFGQLFLIMFLWFQFLYLILLRTFNGATIGETFFDVRLGLFQERYLLSYPFRVIYRTTFIYLFGIITLPILSWFFKRDLAGDLSGLKITSHI